MKHPHSALMFRRAAFAAALFAGLGAAQALAIVEPNPNTPINGNAALEFIESKLPAGVTLVTPPPVGETLATEAQINTALGVAVTAEIGDSGAFSGSVEDLVREISQYRSTKIDKMILAATSAAIDNSADDTARQANIEAIARGAADANLKDAAKPVTAMLKIVASNIATPAVSDDADDAVREAIEAAENYADKITAAAMKAVQKAPAADVANIMNSIARAAVDTTFTEGAGYLADEVAKAVAANTKSKTTNTALINSIFGSGSAVPTNKEDVALVAAGLMQGGALSDDAKATAIANDINGLSSAYGNFDSYISAVATGYGIANGTTDAAVSSTATKGGIAANAANLAAYITGAGAALPKAVEFFIKDALNVASPDSVEARMRAGVRANQAKIDKIVAAGILTTSSETAAKGQVMQGAAEGLDGNPIYNALIRSAVDKGLKALGGKLAADADVIEVVGYGILGAQSTGNTTAVADITLAATKTTKKADQVITGAFAHVAAADQWRAVLGAIAVDKKTAIAIRDAAKLKVGYNATLNDSPLAQGSKALTDTQNTKLALKSTLGALFDAGTDSDVDVEAVITGAGLISPRDIVSIASAALKYKSATPAAAIRSLAIALNPKAAPGTNAGLDAAIGANANPDNIFDFVDQSVFTGQKYVAEIVAGATVGAPQKANLTAYAASYRLPLKASKVATVVLTNVLGNQVSDANIQNPVAAAAAISAGLTSGVMKSTIVNDPTDSKKINALRGTVANAIKAVIKPAFIEGNGVEGLNGFKIATGAGTDPNTDFTLGKQTGVGGVVTGYVAMAVNPNDSDINSVVTAVLTASVKAAKKYWLEIAQAAGQAARAVAGSNFGPNSAGAQAIADAILLGNSALDPARVLNVVRFGINAAAAGLEAAGAAGLGINYAHHSVNGAAVTDIFEL